jgi:hypothetical protein
LVVEPRLEELLDLTATAGAFEPPRDFAILDHNLGRRVFDCEAFDGVLAPAGGQHAGVRLFTVERIVLRRLYVLFVLEVGVGASTSPAARSTDRQLVAQQARGSASPTCSFDDVFCSEGIRVIRTSIRSPRRMPTPSVSSFKAGSQAVGIPAHSKGRDSGAREQRGK